MARPFIFITTVSGGALAIATLLLVLSTLTVGSRSISRFENIHGIPYTQSENRTHVTEKLAHADIYLLEPVIAKNLQLTVTFSPPATQPLFIGVRANEFWLSYPWIIIYDPTTEHAAPEQTLTKTITIPLTDKLQEPDRSIDLMILAGPPAALIPPDTSLNDTTNWYLTGIQAATHFVQPTRSELKDYIRSIITREKAL